MKRFLQIMALTACISAAAITIAQPPGGGRGGEGRPGGGGEGGPVQHLLDMFKDVDKDKDGLISKAELQAAASQPQDDRRRSGGERGGGGRGAGGPGGGGPGGPGGGGSGGRPKRGNVDLGPDPLASVEMGPELNTFGALKVKGDAKFPFTYKGDVVQGLLGDSRQEHNGGGVRFFSGEDRNKDGEVAGEATCSISGFNDEKGRWFRFRITGIAQDDFSVEQGELYIKAEFFKDGGTNSLDSIRKSLVGQLELDRKSFSENFQSKKLGLALWRNYAIEVRTPFAEVDTVKVSIGFAKGNGKGANSEFWVRELEVRPIPTPANYVRPDNNDKREPVALQSLVKLGGHWYFDPRGGDKTPPKQFDYTNVDQLYYFTDRLETPFAGNVTAWLQPNYVDRDGKKVVEKRFINDSVIITFTDKHLVMKSQNIPNHPVAVFPDISGFQGGNPGKIRELNQTWSIPLEPKENPNRGKAISMENKNALPMGPIGVSVNGVVFYNPFDGPGHDAALLMDRCCGHTGPTSQYHYHKYPVCINTPWADDGETHSPLIGFAFDGYPVYGPYESKGVLAKDSTDNPLNDFNVHTDEARGPHYHVTPGRFPHMIGGYWGEVDSRGRGRGGPR